MHKIHRFYRFLEIIFKEMGLCKSLTHFIRVMKMEFIRAEQKFNSGNNADKKEILPPAAMKKAASGEGFRVLILHGFPEDWALYRYRVKQKLEQLRAAGIEVQEIHFDAPDLIEKALGYSHLIWYRLPITNKLRKLAEQAQIDGIKNIYDIDDLIFDLEICKQIDGIQILNEWDKQEYLRNMACLGEAMKLCPYGLVPTSPLKERLEKLGLMTYIHRNGFDAETREISERAIRGKVEKKTLIISYLSGSNTHDRDFQICAPALAKVLARHEQVRLYLFGYVGLGSILEPFARQIVQIPFMAWKELFVYSKDVDINLSPLENNEFCNSKSELKYIKAAMLEIPTIASPRAAFRDVIQHGENGFLAEEQSEWVEGLEKLIHDRDQRVRIGKQARAHVLEKYDIHKMGVELAAFLKSL